jgi:hypothetical protein
LAAATDDIAGYFARQLRKDHPGFDPHSVTFVQPAEQQKTPAGKHRLFRVSTSKAPTWCPDPEGTARLPDS